MCQTIILHADDFGLNTAVTAGILRGFRHGLLTSTSLLANAPDADVAVTAWKEFARRGADAVVPSLPLRRELDDARRPFDLGVHLNLTQGRPLTGSRYPAELLDREGRFPGIFGLFRALRRRTESHFAAPLRDELAAQIAWLVDRGVPPTHLNGHQYVELLPQVAALLPELLAHFRIRVMRSAVEPALARTTLWHGFRFRAWMLAAVKKRYARRMAASPVGMVAAAPAVYFGTAHAGRIDGRVLELYLDSAGRDRVVEVGLHPGLEDDRIRPHEICEGWDDPLAAFRPRELALLESPQLAERLRSRGIRLGRLAQLEGEATAKAA